MNRHGRQELTGSTEAVREEQLAADVAYRELDRRREQTRTALRALLGGGQDATPAGRSLRDAEAARLAALGAQLDRVERRLVFGRVDTADGALRVGRTGLANTDGERLVVDWRAEAARAFYEATAARPAQVRRRRHIELDGRTVTRVTDDLAQVAVGGGDLRVDAVLLAAIEESRTDRMSDVVATLQADQDRIIRAPLPGVLIVQGAPGTGKTAVALHRAAYLLYSHRHRLARRGVLLVGPHHRFLSYVSEVLPSLGEDSVHSTTVTELAATHLRSHGDDHIDCRPDDVLDDPPEVAALKGDLRMAALLARAVERWPRALVRPIPLTVDGGTVLLTPDTVRRAQRTARADDRPYNRKRERFCEVVLDDLLQQLGATAPEALEDHDRRALLARLHESPDVRREVNLCWMPLTPQAVLRRLWAQPDRLRAAAADSFTPEETASLHRRDPGAWTSSDLVLLAELASLLGPPTSSAETRARQRRHAAQREERVRFAHDALASLGVDTGLVDPERLVDRYYDDAGVDRAPTDGAGPAWGHVVVDEAQELTPMAWRLLLRSCPGRSVTAVGDINQSTTPGAPSSWAEIMDQLGVAWRLEQLTVNYRTTAAITAVADRLLTGPAATAALRDGDPPRSVRLQRMTPAALATMLDRVLPATPGSVAVIIPHEGFADLDRGALAAGGTPLPVLPPGAVKGLEFDRVVVVEPAAFLRRPRGRQALYVALTRPTRDLIIAHTEDLPTELVAGLHQHSARQASPTPTGTTPSVARADARADGDPP